MPILVDERAEHSLLDLINRVCPGSDPRYVAETVSKAFKRAQTMLPTSDMAQVFRGSKGDEILREALATARAGIEKPSCDTLVLGCGRSYAGASGDYLDSVVRSVLGCAGLNVRRVDLTQGDLADLVKRDLYDLAVSHSVAHFIPDLASFFRYVRESIAPGGYFILSREPNRRFWRNEDCQGSMKLLRASEQLKVGAATFFAGRRWLAQIRDSIRGERRVPLHDAANRILQKEFGYRRPLAHVEMARVVDPHLPSDYPGDFSIGFDAFDWALLGERYLPDFRLLWVRTWAHLGRRNEAKRPELFREMELARKYPQDGCFFSAIWQKNAADDCHLTRSPEHVNFR